MTRFMTLSAAGLLLSSTAFAAPMAPGAADASEDAPYIQVAEAQMPEWMAAALGIEDRRIWSSNWQRDYNDYDDDDYDEYADGYDDDDDDYDDYDDDDYDDEDYDDDEDDDYDDD